MTLNITNLKPRIGVQIHTDMKALLSGHYAADIRALLEQRGVILIRGLQMNDEQQLAFTKTLGTVSGGDELYTVSLDKKVNLQYAEYNRLGNFSWHIDGTDTDVPPLCSMLRAQQLSPTGGETPIANTYAAYEDLPESEKLFLDKLKVVHLLKSSFRECASNPTPEQLAEWRNSPSKIHPLVWHHRSGRNSLAISTSATDVIGMEKQEGAALLRRLMAWTTQSEYVYTHEWQLGDLAFWDNTGTMHKALPYGPNSGRLMRRTRIEGEKALA